MSDDYLTEEREPVPLVTIADDVVLSHVVDETVLMNPSSGEYFGLNATGRAMLERARVMTSVEEVVAALATEYDVDEDQLQQDFIGLLRELESAGLVSVRPGGVAQPDGDTA
jgi:PqqD family protein of HPr-rel-A system